MQERFSLRRTHFRGALSRISINSASDLIDATRKMPNSGDRIELFFSFAETKPDVAFKSFITVLNTHAGIPLRALALRSIGKITHPATRQEIVACQSEYSQQLLKLLAEEVNGRSEYSNDLTRWAAAEAIIALGYDLDHVQHTALGGLVEPPRRIGNDIVQKKLKEGQRLSRYDSRKEFTPEYERYLEFWIYGPTERFFSEPNYYSYTTDDIKNILILLQVRGLELGFQPSSNEQVHIEAYALSKGIFEQYLINRDPWLGESLKRFLKAGRDDALHLEELGRSITFSFDQTVNKTNFLGSFFNFTQTVNRPNLLDLTMDELRREESESKRYHSQICSLLSTAMSNCGNSILLKLLQSEFDRYLSNQNSWIAEVTASINKLDSEQKKISSNCYVLNQTYEQLGNIDSELYDQAKALPNQEIRQIVTYLPNRTLKDENEIRTINKCRNFSSVLESVVSGLFNKCSDRKSTLREYIGNVGDTNAVLGWGIAIVVVSYFFFHAVWWLFMIGFTLIGLAIYIYIKDMNRREKIKKIEELENTIIKSWQR